MPADPQPGGPDLARAALEQAKEAARARGAAPGGGRRAGRPRRVGADGADRGDPEAFGAAIGRLLAERGWEGTARAAAVMGRWESLVGPDLAAHCAPSALRDGELVLVAESTAWATQIRLLAGTVVERLTAELGPGVVRRIRVHGPTGPSWRKGPRRVVGPGPRDTYG